MGRSLSLEASLLPAAMIRHTVWAVLLTLPLLVGCPTEVPYESATEVPDIEAPDFDTTESSEAIGDDAPAPDRYTTDGAEEAEPQVPWNTDQSSETPEELERLFGAVDPSEEPTGMPAGEAAEEPDESEDGGFGDFLDDAYSGMIDADTTPEEAASPAESVEAPQPETVAATPKQPSEVSSLDLDDLFGDTTPSPTPEPKESESSLEAFTPEDAMREPIEDNPIETLPAPEPKPPTTTAPANSDLLAELWGDEDPAPAAEAPDPTPEPPARVDPPAEREVELPTPAQDPTPLFDEPAPSVEPFSEVTPEPADRLEFEPEAPEPAAWPTTPRDGPPLASAAIKPLPTTPALSFNTRHLAWLLGGKLALAELADLDGATPSEVATWSREMERLARELGIETPTPQPGSAGSPARRVGGMMGRASRVGAELSERHGADHAALLEIALKSNALLVVAEQRPDLAGPVGAAIRDAATRARLPRFLWESTVKTLGREPDSADVLESIERLHQRVESFLR